MKIFIVLKNIWLKCPTWRNGKSGFDVLRDTFFNMKRVIRHYNLVGLGFLS